MKEYIQDLIVNMLDVRIAKIKIANNSIVNIAGKHEISLPFVKNPNNKSSLASSYGFNVEYLAHSLLPSYMLEKSRHTSNYSATDYVKQLITLIDNSSVTIEYKIAGNVYFRDIANQLPYSHIKIAEIISGKVTQQYPGASVQEITSIVIDSIKQIETSHYKRFICFIYNLLPVLMANNLNRLDIA